jgi:hypothetical protein
VSIAERRAIVFVVAMICGALLRLFYLAGSM